MKSLYSSEKSVFLDALDIESLSDRAAFVADACQGNAEMFAAVSLCCGNTNANSIRLTGRSSRAALGSRFMSRGR